MAKFNKEFNEIKFQELEKRIRENIITSIQPQKKSIFISFFQFKKIAFSLSILILGIFISQSLLTPQNPDLFTLEDTTLERMNEMIYFSIAYFDDNPQVHNNILPMIDSTELEANSYLDFEIPVKSLNSLINNNYTNSKITLVNNEYAYTVDFTVDDFNYTLIFDIKNNNITGLIVIDNYTLNLSGLINNTTGEIDITISDGLNYINIIYSIENNKDNIIFDAVIHTDVTAITQIQVIASDDLYMLEIYELNDLYTLSIVNDNQDYNYVLSYFENDININVGIIFGDSLLFEVINDTPLNNDEYYVDVDYISEQLLLSSFVSTSFLFDSSITVNNNGITKLGNRNIIMAIDSEFEKRLTEFDSYVNLLDIFLNGNVLDNIDAVTTETPLEEYYFHLTYEINNSEYKLDYNIFDSHNNPDLSNEEFILEGVIIFNGNSYEISGGLENESGSMEMWFETINSFVNIRVEVESDEFEYYYQIEKETIQDSVYYEFRSEKDGLDGTIEFYIEENGIDSYYEMTKEIDSPFTIYYFDYSVGDISGSVTLMIYIDNGIEVKYYIIEEGDYYKEILIPSTATHPDDL